MTFGFTAALALRGLSRRPGRSALTLLGIVIGVAAVVAVVALGNGAKAAIERSVADAANNQMMISYLMPRSLARNGVPPPVPPNDGIRISDYKAILRQVEQIKLASAFLFVKVNVAKANGRKSDVFAVGSDVDGPTLDSRRIVLGRTFSEMDITRAATVCLISETVARNLFDTGSPLGRSILLQNVPFAVIGVTADKPPDVAMAQGFQDNRIILPYTTARLRLDRTASISIYVRADSPLQLRRIGQQSVELLESRRGGRVVEFVASNPQDAVKAYSESSRTMARLLAAVGGISLIVGGIGIMNIMLVSVTERTREIGLRLAVGTRALDVLRQFLTEAIVLSLVGGMIGVLLGVAASVMMAVSQRWAVEVTPGSIVMALAFSAGVGVIFGFYPARRAAALQPVQALRME